MRARRSSGYSLLEILLVVAIVGVAAAVAAPLLAPADRTARVRTAAETVAARLRLAVDRAAKTGRSVSLDLASVPLPSGVALNSSSVDPPPGAYRVDTMMLQGGTGNPYALGANRAVVAVLSAEADPSAARALTLTASGQLKRWRLSGSQWEEFR